MTLEAPIIGVGAVSRVAYDTREVAVYWSGGVGSDTTLQVALKAQPDTALTVPYTVPPDPATGGQSTQATTRLPVRAPYLFEPLRVLPR